MMSFFGWGKPKVPDSDIQELKEFEKEAENLINGESEGKNTVETKGRLSLKNPEAVIDYVNNVSFDSWHRERLKSVYGHGTWGKIKSFLSGEFDFHVKDGEVKHSIAMEFSRRLASTVLNQKVLVSGGLSLIAGAIMSNGVSLLASAGGAIGRSVGEIIEASSGKERGIRERLMYEYFQEYESMQKVAEEIKSLKGDEKNKKIEELINLICKINEDIIATRKDLNNIKKETGKTKEKLTSIGMIGGALYNIYHGFAGLDSGAKELGYHDYDGDGVNHLVKEVGGQKYYLYENAQDIAREKAEALADIAAKHPDYTKDQVEAVFNKFHHIVTGDEFGRYGAHLLGNADVAKEVLSPGWKDLVVNAVAVGGAHLLPLFVKGKDEAEQDWHLEKERNRLLDINSKEEKKRKDIERELTGEIQLGQIWEFNKLDGFYKQGQPKTIIIDNLPFLQIPGRWEVIGIDNNLISLKTLEGESIKLKDKDAQEYDLKTIKLKYKDVLDYGNRVLSDEEKEKKRISEELSTRRAQEVISMLNNKENKIVVFRGGLRDDFFSNLNLNVDPKREYSVDHFDLDNNKLTLIDERTGDKIETNFTSLLPAIYSVIKPDDAKKYIKESTLKEKFNKISKRFPTKDDVWGFNTRINGKDDEGNDIGLDSGLYKINSIDEKNNTVEVRSIIPPYTVGKVEIKELIRDDFGEVNQIVENILRDKERGGQIIPVNKKIEMNQKWNYKYDGPNNPDPVAQNYTVIRMEDGEVTLKGTYNGRDITRVVDKISLATNSIFVP